MKINTYNKFLPHPYCRVEAGFEERKFWKEMLKNSYISIGYPAPGDLSRIEFPTATEGLTGLFFYQFIIFAVMANPEP